MLRYVVPLIATCLLTAAPVWAQSSSLQIAPGDQTAPSLQIYEPDFGSITGPIKLNTNDVQRSGISFNLETFEEPSRLTGTGLNISGLTNQPSAQHNFIYKKYPQPLRFPARQFQVPRSNDAADELYDSVLDKADKANINRCVNGGQTNFIETVYYDELGFDTTLAKSALLRHDKACLTQATLDVPGLDVLLPTIGVLYSKFTGEIICTVSKIDETLVVTARHCTAVSRGRGYELTTGSAANFSVLMFVAPRREMQVVAIREMDLTEIAQGSTFNELDQANDVVLFEVAENLPGDTVSIGSKVKKNDRLVVPGAHLHLLRHRKKLRNGNPRISFEESIADWEEFLRVDELGTCRVFHVATDNGCLIHSCQTESGWSGGPIFLRDSGEIVAVHTGSAFLKSSCRSGLPDEITKYMKAQAPNVGVLVSDRLTAVSR